MNGSSRKYTGGQSRDQSLFENGVMWNETEFVQSFDRMSGLLKRSDFFSRSHADGHHVVYGCI